MQIIAAFLPSEKICVQSISPSSIGLSTPMVSTLRSSKAKGERWVFLVKEYHRPIPIVPFADHVKENHRGQAPPWKEE